MLNLHISFGFSSSLPFLSSSFPRGENKLSLAPAVHFWRFPITISHSWGRSFIHSCPAPITISHAWGRSFTHSCPGPITISHSWCRSFTHSCTAPITISHSWGRSFTHACPEVSLIVLQCLCTAVHVIIAHSFFHSFLLICFLSIYWHVSCMPWGSPKSR